MALKAFNLKTGAPTGSWAWPAPTPADPDAPAGINGFCNDITIDAEGNVYATDSWYPRILRASEGRQDDTTPLEVWVTDPTFGADKWHLNGIDVDQATRTLYVVENHPGHLWRIPINRTAPRASHRNHDVARAPRTGRAQGHRTEPARDRGRQRREPRESHGEHGRRDRGLPGPRRDRDARLAPSERVDRRKSGRSLLGSGERGPGRRSALPFGRGAARRGRRRAHHRNHDPAVLLRRHDGRHRRQPLRRQHAARLDPQGDRRRRRRPRSSSLRVRRASSPSSACMPTRRRTSSGFARPTRPSRAPDRPASLKAFDLDDGAPAGSWAWPAPTGTPYHAGERLLQRHHARSHGPNLRDRLLVPAHRPAPRERNGDRHPHDVAHERTCSAPTSGT